MPRRKENPEQSEAERGKGGGGRAQACRQEKKKWEVTREKRGRERESARARQRERERGQNIETCRDCWNSECCYGYCRFYLRSDGVEVSSLLNLVVVLVT